MDEFMNGLGDQDFGDFVPESLFEAIDQLNNGGKGCDNISSTAANMDEFMDFELEQEIREAPLLSEPLVRPSVIVKPRHKPTVQPSLSDIMDSCGIEYDLPGDCNANISSPSSIHSDVQLEQNRELIDELEEFFINTDGKPTVVDDCEELILDDQYSP